MSRILKEKGYIIKEFKEQLRLLKYFFHADTNKELAEKLGISEVAIKKWKSRNSIPMKYMKMIEERESILEEHSKKELIESSLNDIKNMLSKLDEQKIKYYYHLIKAEYIKDIIEKEKKS